MELLSQCVFDLVFLTSISIVLYRNYTNLHSHRWNTKNTASDRRPGNYNSCLAWTRFRISYFNAQAFILRMFFFFIKGEYAHTFNQWFSPGDSRAPQEPFDNVLRRVWWSQMGGWWLGGHLVGRGWRFGETHCMGRSAPPFLPTKLSGPECQWCRGKQLWPRWTSTSSPSP